MTNGLYDVPQTDQASEPAMADFLARLRASCPKPEAIPTGASTDDALAVQAAEAIATVTSALADRATPPILQWDARLDGCARKIALRDWLNTRGRNRQAGADNTIDVVADAAEAYLARIRPGGDLGQSENPRYVDSGGNATLNGPRLITSTRSDDWTRIPLPRTV